MNLVRRPFFTVYAKEVNMKFIKKLFACVLTGCILAGAMAGCGGSAAASGDASSSPSTAGKSPSTVQTEKATMKVATLKGPTGMGMLKLMSDNDAKTASNNYQFSIAGTPDEIVSKISTGEIDAASVPTNLAAVLYNKTKGKVQLAAINTLGVLSILTNGQSISSVQDLKGKTVYSSGQGSTPEYALNYILKQNGLQAGKDVRIEYKAEHAELAALVISGKAKIALLPEPFVTQVMAKNKDVKLALNVTQEWDKAVSGKSVLSMGGLLVRKEFAEKNKTAFNQFLDEYKASTAYTASNLEETAELSEKYGIMPSAVAKKAIPNCNIVYMDGAEMKSQLPEFLKILYTANPKSVGGALPGDDFYYAK
jgi:NitT/TauT family transport system substrate-binding protein